MDRLISEERVLRVVRHIIRWMDCECDKSEVIKLVEDRIKAIPSAEPTEEQVKLYCRNRDLVLVDNDFMVHIIKGTLKAYTYKGMTNGEVIKAVFPNAETWEEKEENVMRFVIEGNSTLECFNLDWWNNPYKGEQE